MTAAKLAEKHQVNIMRIDNSKYVAFRGGNGTGLPVEDIAEAYTLATLDTRLNRKLSASTK